MASPLSPLGPLVPLPPTIVTTVSGPFGAGAAGAPRQLAQAPGLGAIGSRCAIFWAALSISARRRWRSGSKSEQLKARDDAKLSNDDIEAMRDPRAVDMAMSKVMSVAADNVDATFPPFGRTALIRASDLGQTRKVHQLLQMGANVNAMGSDGSTALSMASNFDDAELVGMLLTAGAKVDSRDDEGSTPLMVAAYNGNAEVVQLLLEANADINAENEEGITPVAAAELGGFTKVAQLLQRRGGRR